MNNKEKRPVGAKGMNSRERNSAVGQDAEKKLLQNTKKSFLNMESSCKKSKSKRDVRSFRKTI